MEAEFSASLSKVQSELRQVATDANNPQTRSRYATLFRFGQDCTPNLHVWVQPVI